MSHRTGFLALLVVLGLAGCAAGDDREDSDSGTASASTATCPNGGDRRTTVYDLGRNPDVEATPIHAVEVFLRQKGGDAITDDFEQLGASENEKNASFVYSDGDFELARLYVKQLKGGWLVVSYEYCQGAI